MEEAVAKTCDRSFDAWNLCYVDAGADDHADSLVDGRLLENRHGVFVLALPLAKLFRRANSLAANS
jgi:hypothetical protein